MKPIIVCADDFGMDAAVSAGILDCVDAGRVSATSCMTLSAYWPECAAALRERREYVDCGVHLDLTEFSRPNGASLARLILACYGGQVNATVAATWVNAQLDAFERVMRVEPCFLDGHQHVHQLPAIRDAVVSVVRHRYGGRCALRSTRATQWRGLKSAVIDRLGAAELSRQAQALGLRMNRDFAGVYDFNPDADFEVLMAGWLASLEAGGMVMTHPARPSFELTVTDTIRAARVREHAWWLSGQAGDLLKQLQIKVARFHEI